MASALPKYESKKLSNGMEVVAVKLKQNSVVTVDVFYKVGSRNEVMGKSGIAHMLEHLNFKSTKNLKAGEFDEIIKGYGGVNNASTGFDYTHYYINCASQNIDKSMELFAELMQNLSLKDEEFQPERDVVAEERRWRTDNNPMGYLYFNLFNLAFGYHPYHWTPIGFMDDILTWKIDDIKSFHKKFYQPSNAILIVAGDIEPKDVFEKAKKHFENIKNNGEIPAVHMQEPKQDGEKRAVVYKDTNVDMLAIAYKIPNYEHEDIVALSALSEILSSGKSSRLQKELSDKKRLVNSVYGYTMDLKDPGLFIFMAVCNEGVKAETVEKEILKEIDKLKTKGIDKKELEKVKTNTKADFIFNLESSSHVADLFGSYMARGNVKPLLEYEDKLSKLSAEDIINVANKYFTDDTKTTIILRKKDKQ
ncbi:MAG: M16 family metallopeptidase [Campylobacterales bacterium]